MGPDTAVLGCEREIPVTLTSDLESHGDDAAVAFQDEGAAKVVGRSPRQLAIAKDRADRLSMISFYASAFIVLCAISAPILVAAGVLDPQGIHAHPCVHD